VVKWAILGPRQAPNRTRLPAPPRVRVGAQVPAQERRMGQGKYLFRLDLHCLTSAKYPTFVSACGCDFFGRYVRSLCSHSDPVIYAAMTGGTSKDALLLELISVGNISALKFRDFAGRGPWRGCRNLGYSSG
jgi:hypothetical protein